MTDSIIKIDNETIQIVTNNLTTKNVSINDLVMQRTALNQKLIRFEQQVVEDRNNMTIRLTKVNDLIAHAALLGIPIP